jgi:hypothetical protein
MLDNVAWQAALRQVGSLCNCKLPTQIVILGDRQLTTIGMRLCGVASNMQTDAAAFEAWALALLVHCGVQKVRIELADAPQLGSKERPHFERFLYRLHRFCELFPDKVEVDPALSGGGAALLRDGPRLLNVPRAKRVRADKAKLMSDAASPAASESALEKALEISDAFRRYFQFNKVIRQWPVGLFDKSVTADTNIFTRYKSAIDLIGVRGDELVLVELKKPGKGKAGALSELMFYASLMRDALGRTPLFCFERARQTGADMITPSDITACSRILAVLLAPSFHPLVDEPQIVAQLNAASATRWPERPVRFEVVKFQLPKLGGDFSFAPVH